MKGIPEVIAFAALTVCTAALEINGKDVDMLWVVIVFWVIFSDWGQK